MIKRRNSRKPAVPLIIEPHPVDYVGLPFLTLVQYRKQPMLAIIDNLDTDAIRAYVLDMCGPEDIDEEVILTAAAEWYATNRHDIPVSIEFSRMGLTPLTTRIYRVLNVEFVSRIIGPVPKFPMNTVKSVKRRRRRVLPANIEIHTASEGEKFS
jgi:hypothetical protein